MRDSWPKTTVSSGGWISMQALSSRSMRTAPGAGMEPWRQSSGALASRRMTQAEPVLQRVKVQTGLQLLRFSLPGGLGKERHERIRLDEEPFATPG